MKRVARHAAVAAFAILCLAPVAHGAPINLVVSPMITSGPITGAAVVAARRPAQWFSGAGNWWAPSADQRFAANYIPGTGSLPGNYVYEVAFDLTGFDPLTAILAGTWSTDNAGSIRLNAGPVTAIGPVVYGSQFPFVFNSGFLPGINKLVFTVNNETPPAGAAWDGPQGQNPTGVYIDITRAVATPVPEPATLTLFGLALLGLGSTRRRRRR